MDRVERVINSIDDMLKRRQITARQKLAADRYRWAFETCPGSIRSALDMSGAGGAASHAGPNSAQARAVAILIDAERWLGLRDGQVVRLVCGEGRTLKETAATFYAKASERDQSAIGVRLREGLTTLADRWFPEQRQFRSERFGPRSEITTGTIDEASTKGRVAHATRTRVFGYEPQGGQPDAPELRKRARDRRRA